MYCTGLMGVFFRIFVFWNPYMTLEYWSDVIKINYIGVMGRF